MFSFQLFSGTLDRENNSVNERQNGMIIHESRKALNALLLLVLISSFSFAQEIEPAPTFRLINAGYGSAALGMGGAFVAIANDMSAIYWNPAGLAQLPGLQIAGDYRLTGDSDEDFSEEVFPNRFESAQRFAISGDDLQAIGVSYAFQNQSFAIVPAFAWHRLSATGPERELKETAGVVEFLDRDSFIQSEGIFTEETKDDEEEFTFAIGARVSNKILIGGSWSFLRNGPDQTVVGDFTDTLVVPGAQTRTILDLTQTYREERSGNYFKFGALFYPQSPFSFGGSIRLPYKIESDIFLERTGPFVLEESLLENGQIVSTIVTNGTLAQNVTARSEIEFPMEISGGLAMRPSNSLLVSGSVTYSDWTDVERIVTDSSNPLVLAEQTLPYPALRPTATQTSMLQWRAGMEYLFGHFGRGLVIRSGIFRDGQPYADADGDRVYWNGYTAGVGLGVGSMRFDVAFVSEEADLFLTPNSRTESHLKHRRWQFSVGYISL
jgi:long-subunit fatty acid transport protein